MHPSPPTAWLSPLGLRTVVEAEDAELLAAVSAAFGPVADRAAPDAPPPLRLRIARGGADEAGPVEIAVEGRRITLAGGGVRGEADTEKGVAWCTVPPSLATDPERLVAEVVDPLLLFLLTRAGRVPVHGAGVVLGGGAVVLAGGSGAGKSTLAHAAARAGIPVLSDDTVYVQLGASPRVWGLARPIHLLREEAPSGGHGRLRLRAGRWKRAVPLPARTAPAAPAALCLLEHGAGAALHPVPPEEAVERLVAAVEPGFDHFRDSLPQAVRALAARGAWRLVLSRDPGEALALLRATLKPPPV